MTLLPCRRIQGAEKKLSFFPLSNEFIFVNRDLSPLCDIFGFYFLCLPIGGKRCRRRSADSNKLSSFTGSENVKDEKKK